MILNITHQLIQARDLKLPRGESKAMGKKDKIVAVASPAKEKVINLSATN